MDVHIQLNVPSLNGRAPHDLSVTDKQTYTMNRVNWTTSNTSYSALTLCNVLWWATQRVSLSYRQTTTPQTA